MNKHSIQYIAYMQSDTWRRKREERLKIDKYRCCACGTFGTAINKIEVHHMGYKKDFGTEDPYRDLITLCTVCHMQVHRMMKRPTDPSGISFWEENTPEKHEYDYNRQAIRETITALENKG